MLINALLLFTAFQAHAAESCYRAPVTTRYFGQDVRENASFCFDPEAVKLTSESCRRAEPVCAALRAVQSAPRGIDFEKDDEGSPGFQFCKAVGGQPEMVTLHLRSGDVSSDRCIFVADRSFLDTQQMIEIYRKRH